MTVSDLSKSCDNCGKNAVKELSFAYSTARIFLCESCAVLLRGLLSV
jgi:hypothetical protein